MGTSRLSMFVSYAHEDKEYLDLLLPTLKKCELELSMEMLYDRRILAGSEWNTWIVNSLSCADIILCLISTDYLVSDFIIKCELPIIEERFENGIPVIPVFVRHCKPREHCIFATVQGANSPERPISSMSPNDRDHFFASVEQDIHRVSKEVLKKREWEMKEIRQDGILCSTVPQKLMADARYNIVVVGRTGVGKSALINYLFGDKIRNSGVGLPVTERGFHRVNLEISGVPATLFDSWGLETANADMWLKDLQSELSRRDVSEPVPVWFHTIIYCLQASSHRVEPFEVQILRKFLDEKYRVIVAFTKADAVSRQAIATLVSTIQTEVGGEIPCIPVCSVSEETLTGITAPFGSLELIDQICKGYWTSIVERVPSRCITIICQYVHDEYKRLCHFVEEESGYFNHKSIARQLNSEFERMVTLLTKRNGVIECVVQAELGGVLKLYRDFATAFSETQLNNVGTPGKMTLSPDSYFPVRSDIGDMVIISLNASAFVGAGVSVISSALAGTSGLFGLFSGPVAIGIGIVVVSKIKHDFVQRTLKGIEDTCNQIIDKLLGLEVVIRNSLLGIPVDGSDQTA